MEFFGEISIKKKKIIIIPSAALVFAVIRRSVQTIHVHSCNARSLQYIP